VVGISKSNTSLSATLITGSTAAGKVFPPHIQFRTKAKSNDTARINIDAAEHIQHILRQFGCKEVKPWPSTFGMNKKGGMDNEEFAHVGFHCTPLPRCSQPARLSRPTQG
jgi:hypothetical protein